MNETVATELRRRWPAGARWTPAEVRDQYRAVAAQFPAVLEDIARLGRLGRSSFEADPHLHAYRAGVHDLAVNIHQLAGVDLTEAATKEMGNARPGRRHWWPFC